MTPDEARLAVDRWVADTAVEVAGGVLLRSRRFPRAWDLNRLVLHPGAGPGEVARAVEAVERELDGAGHRKVTVPAPAGPVAVPAGWSCDDLLLMVFEGGPPDWPDEAEAVPAAGLREARLAVWRRQEPDAAEELADMQVAFASYPGARCVAAGRDGGWVAWATVAQKCIDDVWVEPGFRGQGLGRAVTAAAVAAGGRFLWTDAADPRPRGLYRSLGFREAGRSLELTRRVAPGG